MSTHYRKLSAQQRRFVDLIVRRTNGTDAIRAIRPQLKRPDVLAAKWKALPDVKAAIAEREDEAIEEAGITNAQILLEVARLGFANIQDFVSQTGGETFFDISKVDRMTAAAVQEFTIEETTYGKGENERMMRRTRLKLCDKKGSLELLGKHKKLWTEKHEMSGPNGTPLQPPSIAITFPDGGPGSKKAAVIDDGVETS
jgi:phage terminase small subunit